MSIPVVFALLMTPIICEAETFGGQPLADRPGTKITRFTDGDAEITQLERNGVTITERRQGTNVEKLGVDNSGHGAVLCAWNYYRAYRLAFEICFKGKYPDLRQDLDKGISDINSFIAENDIVPNTRAQVENAMKEEYEAALTKIMTAPAERIAGFCASNDYAMAVVKLSAIPRAERMRRLADLLAVPRPPVVNPCS